MHWYFLCPLFWFCKPGGVGGILAALMGWGTISMEGVDTVGGDAEDADPLLRAYSDAGPMPGG